MGWALIGGVIGSNWAAPSEILVVDSSRQARARLAEQFPGVPVSATPDGSEGAVLSVKPEDAETACHSVAGLQRRVLSVMAGVTLRSLESWLGTESAVVRAMPNQPALIGAGVAAIAGGGTAGDADMDWAESILGSVGKVTRVSEELLDAVTGLSGSGPAYVFSVAESLIEAGVRNGLPREVSHLLVLETVLGSARLMLEAGSSPRELLAGVASKGGTTEAGLSALRAAGFEEALVAAVTAATGRARELGRR